MHVNTSASKIDTYEQLAVLATARTGRPELVKLRDALAGERPFGAQVRLLLELARRGHVDLQALLDAYRETVVQP